MTVSTHTSKPEDRIHKHTQANVTTRGDGNVAAVGTPNDPKIAADVIEASKLELKRHAERTESVIMTTEDAKELAQLRQEKAARAARAKRGK